MSEDSEWGADLNKSLTQIIDLAEQRIYSELDSLPNANAPFTQENYKKYMDYFNPGLRLYWTLENGLKVLESTDNAPVTAFNTQKVFDLLTSRSAELRTKAQRKDYFDMSRDKFTFAAEQIEKLIEEIKAL